MAKNYTFNEAVAIIAEGKDLEAIADIGRRYPVLAHKVAVVTAKAGEAFTDLMSFMPDYLTANKVNSAIKAGIAESDSNDEDTDEATDAENTSDESTGGVTWDESMSAKQLWDLLGKTGNRKLAKSTKKGDLIDACKKAFGTSTAETEAEDENEAEETEANENPYEGKSAMELFKECKNRGIKAAPKKPAKFYADLLMKEDAKAAEEESGDDDWDDDEEETPKTASKTKTTGGKKDKAPKSAKKTDDNDEDDDWDI